MEEQTKVICLDEVDSTNQYLKEHAENLPDGCVVTALHQTAGKGRLGKQWHDREGKSLLASWLYKNLTVEQMTLLPFLSGISVRQALEEMGFTPERSRKGNVCVTIGGEGSPLILAAHVDTLGAMVRSIKSNGRLRPTTLGGHQWCTADGENCTVHTRDGKVYTGVVLNKEPSAHVADQKVEATEENMEILLDENVSTEKDVKVLGIQVGDIIAMDPRTVVTPSGYIKSRFLDDKLSAAILLGIAKEVAKVMLNHLENTGEASGELFSEKLETEIIAGKSVRVLA